MHPRVCVCVCEMHPEVQTHTHGCVDAPPPHEAPSSCCIFSAVPEREDETSMTSERQPAPEGHVRLYADDKRMFGSRLC